MLVLPAEIEGITTRKDKTVKLTIGTQELAPDKGGELFGLQNALVYLAIKKENFSTNEIGELEKLKAEDYGGKTPSQRLRNVLFVAWQQNSQGFDKFDLYYDFRMNQIIIHLKNKLE